MYSISEESRISMQIFWQRQNTMTFSLERLNDKYGSISMGTKRAVMKSFFSERVKNIIIVRIFDQKNVCVVQSLDWSSIGRKDLLSHKVTIIVFLLLVLCNRRKNSKVDCCCCFLQHTFVIKLEGRRKLLNTSNRRHVCWTFEWRREI